MVAHKNRLLKISSYIIFCVLIIQECTLHSTLHARVASYNIRREGKENIKYPNRSWKKRMRKVAALIEKINPSVIGIQEATKGQIEDLKALLPDFDAVGESRGASWGGLGADEANPIFYKRDAYELLDSGTFRINKVTGWLPFWTPLVREQTGWLPRICTWAYLKDKKTGKTFYMYNTHLDNSFSKAREFGAKAIRAQMENREPIVLTGDFNAGFTEYLKDVFSNFDHAAEVTAKREGPRETGIGWDEAELKAKMDKKRSTEIDHILVQRGKFHVSHYAVLVEPIGEYSSDHRPSYADVEIK